MEKWCAKGLGAYPYIGTREEYDKLPDIGKAEIVKHFPEHAEWLNCEPDKLSADLRVRMAKGQLLYSDIDALERANYHAATAHLHKARQAAMWAVWEENVKAGQEEMAANAAAREAEWERMRLEGEKRANAAARASYVRQLHSGSGIKQPTGPVTIGK